MQLWLNVYIKTHNEMFGDMDEGMLDMDWTRAARWLCVIGTSNEVEFFSNEESNRSVNLLLLCVLRAWAHKLWRTLSLRAFCVRNGIEVDPVEN